VPFLFASTSHICIIQKTSLQLKENIYGKENILSAPLVWLV